ncbi:hypothetical protein [Fodinicola feengrottensis]|nr:hypothetical protein [Fodinicola feengrottensis]
MTAALDTYAEALESSGQPELSWPSYREALALTREIHTIPWQALVLYHYGRSLRVAGEVDRAVTAWREAYDLFLWVGDPTADTVRDLLAELDRQP